MLPYVNNLGVSKHGKTDCVTSYLEMQTSVTENEENKIPFLGVFGSSWFLAGGGGGLLREDKACTREYVSSFLSVQGLHGGSPCAHITPALPPCGVWASCRVSMHFDRLLQDLFQVKLG